MKNFVLNKFQRVTHVSTCIYQGLFKNIVFRSVALVTKKLGAILKVTKFHVDSVKNESARTKKLQGGGRQTPPPPSLFRVNI